MFVVSKRERGEGMVCACVIGGGGGGLERERGVCGWQSSKCTGTQTRGGRRSSVQGG